MSSTLNAVARSALATRADPETARYAGHGGWMHTGCAPQKVLYAHGSTKK